jgi:hypothetical protein
MASEWAFVGRVGGTVKLRATLEHRVMIRVNN